MKVQLVTDTAADIPQQFIEKYNIEIVPLSIIFGDEVYLDGIEITTHDFYEKMAATQELPKTSQPTPQAFVEAFQRAHSRGPVLCITLSSGISGTYQSALLAKEMVDFEVEVIDSLNISIGVGMQVIEACRLAEGDAPLQEIKEAILKYRSEMVAYFTLNTLENAVKGGRVKPWEGGIAQLLSIKPVMSTLPDGTLGNSEKIRGRKKAIKRLLELVKTSKKDFSSTVIGIAHSAEEDEINHITKELTNNLNPKELIITDLGPVFGTHGGFGVIGIIV
ncbi:MAG: hypothetical protein JM58_08995 [Peptococcaceae bacterium BICA1-8]|nr:MAG: hypothetical protein JM58_08995 [Peptococcaceae bacterium BICA1-8]